MENTLATLSIDLSKHDDTATAARHVYLQATEAQLDNEQHIFKTVLPVFAATSVVWLFATTITMRSSIPELVKGCALSSEFAAAAFAIVAAVAAGRLRKDRERANKVQAHFAKVGELVYQSALDPMEKDKLGRLIEDGYQAAKNIGIGPELPQLKQQPIPGMGQLI